jgi:nucleoside-diphosphate-sugar epimerase
MLSGERILVTGAAGRIGFGVATALARNNEVWGIARFSDPAERKKLDDLGVKTRAIDLDGADFSELPNNFTYLLHIAASFDRTDFDRALRINAEGTGLLLSRFRNVKAALVMSTLSVYAPDPDPWRAFAETGPLGDSKGGPATYSMSKIAQEAVARYCAREFALPVIIARMGAAYCARGGLPVDHMHAVAAGQPVKTRWDPCPYSVIHQDDIDDQVEPLLAAASTPATIVNWAGDEPVSVQDWTAYYGKVLGKPATVAVTEIPGASHGVVGDPAKRISLTGPCKVSWKDGFKRTLTELYPEQVKL